MKIQRSIHAMILIGDQVFDGQNAGDDMPVDVAFESVVDRGNGQEERRLVEETINAEKSEVRSILIRKKFSKIKTIYF